MARLPDNMDRCLCKYMHNYLSLLPWLTPFAWRMKFATQISPFLNFLFLTINYYFFFLPQSFTSSNFFSISALLQLSVYVFPTFVSLFYFQRCLLLCISTSKWVHRTPFDGRNSLSDAKTTFSVTNGTK